MPPINAFAICGAVVASVATWTFLQFPGLLIWGAFIGWAGFLHSGGTREVMKPAIACLVFGVVMAWIFALIIAGGYINLPVPLAGALIVAVMAPIIISVSRIPLLSVVPASFYGFASCFAYLAQTPGQFTLPAMTSLTLSNAVFIVPISLIIGVGLGHLQTVLAGVLIARTSTAEE